MCIYLLHINSQILSHSGTFLYDLICLSLLGEWRQHWKTKKRMISLLEQCVPVEDLAQTPLSVVFFGTTSLLESGPKKNSLPFQQKIVPIKTVQWGVRIILSNWYVVSGGMQLLSFSNFIFFKAVSKWNTIFQVENISNFWIKIPQIICMRRLEG